MTKKRPYFWLLALTALPVLLMYAAAKSVNVWYPLMRSFVAGLDFTPALARMFGDSDQMTSLLTELFRSGPFLMVLAAIPAVAVCWRAMSWGRPVVRFLCFLLWSAGMAVLCVYLMYFFFLPKNLLFQLSVRPVVMTWLAGSLIWLLAGGSRPQQTLAWFTGVSAVFLLLAALTVAHWPAFLRPLAPASSEELLSTAGMAIWSGLMGLFCRLTPFGLFLRLLPALAASWRAMSWGRPAVRFLCFLLWSAGMALLLFFPLYTLTTIPALLVAAVPLLLALWAAGALVWWCPVQRR